MPMFRARKPRQPRKKSPYPHRGTPQGDAPIGTCPQCETQICRGDAFVVNIDGTVLHAQDCAVDWVIARRLARGEPVSDANFPGPAGEEAGTPYDGEFPI